MIHPSKQFRLLLPFPFSAPLLRQFSCVPVLWEPYCWEIMVLSKSRLQKRTQISSNAIRPLQPRWDETGYVGTLLGFHLFYSSTWAALEKFSTHEFNALTGPQLWYYKSFRTWALGKRPWRTSFVFPAEATEVKKRTEKVIWSKTREEKKAPCENENFNC